MRNNTWKLAGLAVLVIGLAAALISITSTKILTERAAGNGEHSGSGSGATPGKAQKGPSPTYYPYY